MDRPTEDGSTVRAHTRESARRGNPRAHQALIPPPDAPVLDYLRAWHREIRHGAGEGLSGPAPLTWLTLDAWARQTGTHPAPHEVHALFALDAAARCPDPFLDTEE